MQLNERSNFNTLTKYRSLKLQEESLIHIEKLAEKCEMKLIFYNDLVLKFKLFVLIINNEQI
jgi:hypothetical protein